MSTCFFFFIMPSLCIKQGDTVGFMPYLQSIESQEGLYIISGWSVTRVFLLWDGSSSDDSQDGIYSLCKIHLHSSPSRCSSCLWKSINVKPLPGAWKSSAILTEKHYRRLSETSIWLLKDCSTILPAASLLQRCSCGCKEEWGTAAHKMHLTPEIANTSQGTAT